MQPSRSISRRNVLIRAGGLGVGAALATTGLATAAQQATPRVSPDSLPPGLAEWVAAWQKFDIDGVAAAFAEDGVHEDVPQGLINVGPDAIRNRFAATAEAFPNAVADIVHAFASADEQWGAIEWIFSGSYSGELPGFPPGSGQPVVFRGSSIIELADGQVAHERWYYDLFAVLVQVGVLPAPESPQATPAT